jgi:hypothetical protein
MPNGFNLSVFVGVVTAIIVLFFVFLLVVLVFVLKRILD